MACTGVPAGTGSEVLAGADHNGGGAHVAIAVVARALVRGKIGIDVSHRPVDAHGAMGQPSLPLVIVAAGIAVTGNEHVILEIESAIAHLQSRVRR